MQFLTTTFLALVSATAVSANNYTLSCGSSCDTATTIVSTGSDYAGADCTELVTAYPYCTLTSDETQYKAIVSKGSNCLGGDYEQVIWPGECYEGPWESFQVSVNL